MELVADTRNSAAFPGHLPGKVGETMGMVIFSESEREREMENGGWRGDVLSVHAGEQGNDLRAWNGIDPQVN